MIKYLYFIGCAMLLAGCGSMPGAGTDRAAENVIPTIPPAVPVTIDARSSALLVLDVSTAICPPRPLCMATLPAIESLIQRARAAKVPVVYSTTVNPAGPPPMLPAVAPQPGEPTVVARANKFVDTNLEELLKQRKATTLVVVGTAANGAVMYTAFHANARGFTLVVAEDGIAADLPVITNMVRFQLLNQPGAANPSNKPLAERAVTLSRTDLISFK